MSPMSIRHGLRDHMHWPHMSDVRMTSDKLIHSPVFWLVVSLLVFLAAMILLSLIAGDAARPMPSPYYPSGGGWPIYP